MTIQNISGGTYTFKVGKRSHTLADDATVVVDESTDSIADVVRELNAGKIQVNSVPDAVQLAQFFAGTPARDGYRAITFDTLVDENTVTIGGEVFEFDDDATVTGDNIAIDIATGSPSHATIAGRLKTAINANTVLTALGIVATEVFTISATNAILIVEAQGATLIGAVTITGTATRVTVATAVNLSASVAYRSSIVKATAAADTLLINTGLTTIVHYVIGVVTSAGAVKNYDGTVVASAGFMYLNASGSTDLASGDVVTVTAFGT